MTRPLTTNQKDIRAKQRKALAEITDTIEELRRMLISTRGWIKAKEREVKRWRKSVIAIEHSMSVHMRNRDKLMADLGMKR